MFEALNVMQNIALLLLLAFSSICSGEVCHPWAQDGASVISISRLNDQPYILVQVPEIYKGQEFYSLQLLLKNNIEDDSSSFAIVEIKTEKELGVVKSKLHLEASSWLQASITAYYGGVCGLRYGVPINI